MIKSRENKKGAELSVNVIIIVIIALLVLVVLVAAFTGKFIWWHKGVNNITAYCPGTTKLPVDSPSACPSGIAVPYTGTDPNSKGKYCCMG